MDFILGLFRFFLVIDCLLLILLVLIQLPKKEAGLGMAFGGAATDALFGAGAGNAITKITKWVAVIFFVFCLGLSAVDAHRARAAKVSISKELTAGVPAATVETVATDKAVETTTTATNAVTETTPAATAEEAAKTEAVKKEAPAAEKTATEQKSEEAVPAKEEAAPETK